MNKATYSKSKIQKCMEVVDVLTTTVSTKKDHHVKLMKIKQAYDFCYDNTGCCLFDTRISDWEDYARATELKADKKTLDKHLKRCILFLQSQVRGIYDGMQSGQVHVTD